MTPNEPINFIAQACVLQTTVALKEEVENKINHKSLQTLINDVTQIEASCVLTSKINYIGRPRITAAGLDVKLR